MAADLTVGEIVTVPLMPELGIGLIEFTIGEPFNRAVVSFEVDHCSYRDDFGLDEIEKAKPQIARTA